MSTFTSIIALLIMVGGLITTGLVYLQSHGAAIAMGTLFFIVFVAFVVDNRAKIFHLEITDTDKNGDARKRKLGVAMHRGAFVARQEEGDIRGL